MRTILLGAMFLGACAPDVAENRPTAEVKEITPPAEPVPATATPEVIATLPEVMGATKLPIDMTKSKLGAIGAKITAQHPITFKDFSGQIGMDGDELKGVSFIAQIATLESDHPKLTVHLKEADFLDAVKYPVATFKSTGIKAGSDVAGMTHTITGELSIRGMAKEVTFPAKIEVSPKEVHAVTDFVINRQDFGVTYPGKADDLVQDNVAIQVDFIAQRSS